MTTPAPVNPYKKGRAMRSTAPHYLVFCQPTSSVLKSSAYWSRLAVLGALTLMASACQSIPAVQTAPIVAKPNIPLVAGEGYAAYRNQQVPSSVAAMRWQTFYTDPKLKALIQLGLDNNKDVRQTVLAIRKAQAQYRITDNEDLPTLNGSSGYSRISQGGYDNAANRYRADLALANYEIDFWGKVSSLKDQALQNYLATTVASDTAQVSLIANIAKSYVNLSYQLKQLELASKTLDSRKESLKITQARLQAGIDSKEPFLRAQTSVESAYIALLDAQTGVLKAQNALQYLVGAPISEDMMPAPAVSNIVTPQVLSAGLPSELLRYRPDVLQAEYQLKSAGANINVARSAYFPTISLTGSLGYSSGDLTDLFKSSAAGWSFGPSISVPIFDAGRLDANYEVAQIERDQALANYESTIETAFREVNDVLAERATLQAKTEAQYRLQQSYNDIFEIADARWRAQVDDYLGVLDAERSLFATQQSILNLELARLSSQIELYQALGGGANLVEPVAIPTPQHRNLATILDWQTPQDDKAVAMAAIDAASAPIIIDPAQAQAIESKQPVVLTEHTAIAPVDINEDNQVDALIVDSKTTTLPAGSQIRQAPDGDVVIVTPPVDTP